MPLTRRSTGGPGTGKTHTLKAVLTLARAKGLRCLLAAPTGRAAKRMEEAIGLPSGTLHRVLELRPGGKAGHDADNPLEADLVVVDEVSMLDALLANQLVKAVPRGAHLLLVGDPDQLPSAGAGDVLADLLRSEQFPVTRLQHVFRQGAGSGIALNARRVNAGEMPRFGGDVTDCYFLAADEPVAAARLVVDLVAERLPRRYGFGPGDAQVPSPMHRGDVGVGALNGLLQERLNPWREGLPEARGQGPGAEFPAVVIPLVTSHAPMLGRRLLYTALTRTRRLVVIVGQKKALFLAVRDWLRAARHTAQGGLLDGTLRLNWRRPAADAGELEPVEDGVSEGLIGAAPAW